MSFLNLVDFDGSIKRNKKQEALLNTIVRNDRERFLCNLEAQRKARAKDQKQQKAAIVIQRTWRAHRARIRVAQKFREDFDALGRPATKEALNLQITRMNVFYHHPIDDSRLVTLCSVALGLFRVHKEEGELIAPQRRMVFYKCLFKYLSHSDKDTNFVMPIRFLETFIAAQDSVFLAKAGYFECILKLIAKLAPDREHGAPLALQCRLSPRIELLCELLMHPIAKTVSEERFSLHEALNAFGTYPSEKTLPAGIMSMLWQLLVGLESRDSSGCASNHIDLLKMGHPLDDESRDRLTHALSLFCGCLVAVISSIDDADFVSGHPNIVFNSNKLTEIITVIRDVGLGLIDLAFPDDFFVTAKAAEERSRDASKISGVTTEDKLVELLLLTAVGFTFDVTAEGVSVRHHAINVAVRRQHLYEDAFKGLSLGNAPNLRLPIRISMTNWVGLSEVGIDGGGIFREFLTELIRTGFDPDRGFFKYTHDRLLYPNPLSIQLYPDSYSEHFFFLGRVVAKLIYEKQMAEIRFAEFFVSQLLGRRQADVDLHHLKSYDPAIYKHLKSLRSLTADELAALELDFSVIIDDVVDVQTVDLIPDGRRIRVTIDNRLEYIRSYVNLFLYKRIEPLVDAMRAGVSTVVDPGWLAMFSPSELQTLVSGADADLDVDDMMKHCAVHNIKDESDREYMDLFWSVVREMSPEDKRGLLKFITGCSRPPIEGFKMLYPALGIQLVHDSSHLPTSATCMNLFKLPIYSSRAKLEEKLR
uniref:HECT-type E3 ubiquitin transferase n=1 Tax=Angiostrongylus cantonensis TaxID=6313 RepID=A0A158PBS2_ANGCA